MGVELQRGTTFYLVSLCTLLSALAVFGATDPGDIVILEEFRKGIINPEKLGWPEHGDPCGPPSWKYVFCSAGRVTQIQTKNLNLAGSLPKDLNKLTKLSNLGLQNNHLSGPLPSLTGLSELRYAFLDNNNFDSIPNDFFDGLDALEIMALDHNPLNETTGWSLPIALSNSAQLATLSLISSNLAGPLPDFLGSMVSLTSLRLSMNRLSGGIPGTFNGSNLQFLWLNGQDGGGMTGPIDVIATMPSLTSVWLHGNSFTGSIPSAIGDLTSLKDFNLNSNEMVGLIPPSLADLELDNLDLNNNHFMGSIPKFKTKNATYSSNSFCLTTPGLPCAPEVTALIEFLEGLTYPVQLVSSWSGNDPCGGWLGLSCDSNGNVNVINLPNHGLNGTLSPSVAKLGSMSKIILRNNNLNGPIPSNWTTLNSLTLLDLTGNDIAPPLPTFRMEVHLSIDKVLSPTPSEPTKSPSSRVGTSSPPAGSSSSPSIASPSPVALSPPDTSSSPTTSSSQSQSQPHNISASNSTSHGLSPVVKSKSPRWPKIVAIAAPVVSGVLIAFLLVPLSLCYFRKRRRDVHQDPNGIVIHPGDSTDPYNELKIVVTDPRNDSVSTGSGSRGSSAMDESHTIEAGNLVISVQVLRKVTKNFASENEIGRGGFGVVYKGELDYGTKIAVKRMESGVINNKALDEFRSEITVLSKVRHRHLVSLLGYSVQGNERLLVYEYMPQGALSRHLFHWKSLDLEPLSWKQRLNIALDVARGIEYLHALAHQSFIHRDLKSSNILLDDDFRAKVSDFGLVKLAPNGEKSIVTRLAGTFGYLAPEYAVTGKITTKADVFSFGVVLMEILTGLMALDEDRPEEKQYLAAWFWRIKSDKEKLMASMDPTLDIKEDTYDSIAKVAELAGHCTAREPGQRPEMGHAVSVLGSLVEKWRPLDEESEDYCGIDYSLPLNQMVKGWQESEGRDMSYMDLEDSKGSIPSRPTGFADSFTSTDGR